MKKTLKIQLVIAIGVLIIALLFKIFKLNFANELLLITIGAFIILIISFVYALITNKINE